MHFIEAIKLAIDAIHSHKLRSFLTLLGVIFGVATVIVVVSLIEGFNKYVDDKIANMPTQPGDPGSKLLNKVVMNKVTVQAPVAALSKAAGKPDVKKAK